MVINTTGSSDTPIKGKKQDELSRGLFSERYARLVTRFSGNDRSNVFALYGEWGSGKTSVWSMVKDEIACTDSKPLIVEFSPWAYSSYDQVLAGFFYELLAELKSTPVMKQIAEKFGRLGHALSGFGNAGLMVSVADPSGATTVAATTAVAGGMLVKKIAGEAKAAADHTITELRADVAKALNSAKRPILIMVDDVDRLPPAQVTALFQLIRVNASLPMVNYLLLMDREMVEQSLEKQGFPKSYLEKIVQFGIDLPRAAPEDLHAMAVKRVTAVLTEAEQSKLRERFEKAITTAAGVLSTPRAIGRVVESFGFHLEFFRDGNVLEVDPVDLFLLEVLRCQAPRLYAFIREHTGSYSEWDGVLSYLKINEKTANQRQEKLESVLLGEANALGRAQRDIFSELVPGYISNYQSTQEDFAECRLRSDPHFRNYFELTVPRKHPSQADLEAIVTSKTQRAANSGVQNLIDRYTWDVSISALAGKLRAETDPEIISKLTKAIWSADELRIETKGPGAYLLPTSGISQLTITFLHQIVGESERVRILRDAWNESDHFGLFYYVISSEQHQSLKNNQNYRPVLLADTLRQLRREAVAKTKEILDSENVMQNPMLTWLISFNAAAEGPETILKWTEGLLLKPTRLAGFLKNMIRVHRRGDPDEKLNLTYGVLACYFAIDEALVNATDGTAGLSSEDADVIRQAHEIAVKVRSIDHTAPVPEDSEYPKLAAYVAGLV